MANNMRAVTSKSYAYHVDTSFVESHDEAVHDLYVPKPSESAKKEYMAIVEDPLEGWVVQGAQWKSASSAAEAQAHVKTAFERIWAHETDVGSVQQHTVSFFSVAVFQYWPATSGHSEDRVLCSYMRFVRSSGSERLAMDPALLRIREGPTLNKSLVTFCGAMQSLYNSKAASFVDSSQSVMTKLLADSLAGNALTLVIGTLKQGELSESEALLKHLQVGSMLETFPANNNNRVRGLLHGIRLRLHTLQSQKQTLLQQMEDLPDDAPVSAAASNAKLANLIEQNMALKEESAAMVQEKITLQEMLKQHRDTGTLPWR